MNTTTNSLVHKLWNYCKVPPPGVIAQEIVADLQAALEQFRLIADDLAET